MLKTLRLHNFRTFLNAEIEFTNRHLVIGKNNSGKTNLCAALRFLGATAAKDLAASAQLVPGGVSEIGNWAFSSDTVDFSCTCELPFQGAGNVYVYDLQLQMETRDTWAHGGPLVLRVSHERLVVNGAGSTNVALLETDGHEAQVLDGNPFKPSIAKIPAPRDATMLSKLYESETNRQAVLFRQYLSSWGYYALSPEAMRYGWRGSPTGLGALVPHGDNLATALYHLKNIDEQRYRRVIEHVRLIEPDLEAINFVPAPDQAPVPFIALRNRHQASWAGLSDGTLRCLALAYVAESVEAVSDIAGPDVSPLVIIEEPENGIYPGQLRAFFDLFEERAPHKQFIFTSHSPYFINFFDGYRESVTLLRRSKEITEVVPVPPAEDGSDREPLAEQ
ncbi:MAG: AAA family ATPase, partial [Phycisphaerae bacterium]